MRNRFSDDDLSSVARPTGTKPRSWIALGIVTFFVISSKLGGFNAASEAVKAKNPSKLIRGVAEEDQAKFEKSWGSWKAMSQYNYLTKKEKTLTLDEEQKTTAYGEFKPRMPNWQVKRSWINSMNNSPVFAAPEQSRRHATSGPVFALQMGTPSQRLRLKS